jgi:hypothetical protein
MLPIASSITAQLVTPITRPLGAARLTIAGTHNQEDEKGGVFTVGLSPAPLLILLRCTS